MEGHQGEEFCTCVVTKINTPQPYTGLKGIGNVGAVGVLTLFLYNKWMCIKVVLVSPNERLLHLDLSS